jgi:hypothetical protein
MMSSTHTSAICDWRDPEAYSWMKVLPKHAWAWEFLRRNLDYRAAWEASQSGQKEVLYSQGITVIDNGALNPDAARWGLVSPFENPDRDVRDANVFWSSHFSPAVLKFVAIDDSQQPSGVLPLIERKCRTTVYVGNDARQHILFARDGRSLQLEASGSSVFSSGRLLAEGAPIAGPATAYFRAHRQFSDLLRHGDLRAALYPAYSQGRRLSEVAQALDGWSHGATHRQIAVALVGETRAHQEVGRQRSHILDRVRRAIKRGRTLMSGGYRTFLQ